MLIFIIFVVIGVPLIVVGIVRYRQEGDTEEVACWFGSGGICLFIALILSIAAITIFTNNDIEIMKLNNEREYLVSTYNTYKNEFGEDLVHVGTVKELSEEIKNFNENIINENYWHSNVWVGWYNYDLSEVQIIQFNNGYAGTTYDDMYRFLADNLL